MKEILQDFRGPYEIKTVIGRGSLGTVYKAIQVETGRTVAFKVLNAEAEKNADLIGIFQKEMILHGKLKHQNLVDLVDFCAEPPNYYLVTDFIDGWSVRELLNRFQRIPPLVATALCYQILSALDHLHLLDLIHADLSAANILVRKDGQVFVTDLGLASDVDIDLYRYDLIGTAGYYSPEHVTDIPIGPQSDLYCVGLIFYELVSGQKAILNARSADSCREIFFSMKRVNLDLMVCSNDLMQNQCRKTLSLFLQPKIQHRIQNAEAAQQSLQKILLLFGITNPQACIAQFLYDQHLISSEIFEGSRQDIYLGQTLVTAHEFR